MPTHGVSKPPDVAMSVDGTLSEILVTRPIAPKTEMEKWHRPIKKPSVTFNVAVWVVLN